MRKLSYHTNALDPVGWQVVCKRGTTSTVLKTFQSRESAEDRVAALNHEAEALYHDRETFPIDWRDYND